MRILEMTTFLRGGAGSFLTRLSRSLKDKGHEVQVVSTGHSGELEDWDRLKAELTDRDIEQYQINFFNRQNDIFWPEMRKLADLVERNHYDVIHVHAGVPALAAYMAKRELGLDIPVIATFHSWGPNRPGWMDISDAWAFNQCEQVFYDSKEYMKFGTDKGVKASGVIYPGLYVNPAQYVPYKQRLRKMVTARYNVPAGSQILTHLGEITQRKGQIDVVKAMAQLEGSYVALLIGESRDANYQKELDDTIKYLNLENKVIFTGWVEDPYEIVAGSDLFVFPSYSEGLGLAPIEAVTLLVPAIFSSVEGTKDIEKALGEYCTGTFLPGDISSIAKLIHQTLSVDQQGARKTETAAKLANNVFGYDKTIAAYESAMLELYKKRMHR
ncbi:glycosyl transferases group 1 [Lucifera butyrica]|uniref:Glycosyl transferases group 1 n=1 Tax=Lucifera butyrica TaxID=1351585 RepID=A0A498R225_9FIRM|nr:glycosyltransferase [Lucifera butyrica]VBB05514.1 glycosyl transferases group 1 [Lucifera butyrica]